MYNYVMSLFKFDILGKGKKNFIDNFTSILNNGTYKDLELLLQNKKICIIVVENDLFFKNIELIISKAQDSDNILNSVRSILAVNKEYILNNKEKLLKFYNNEKFYSEYLDLLKRNGVNVLDIIDYLYENNLDAPYNYLVSISIKEKNGVNFILKKFDYFLNKNRHLLELRDIVKGTILESSVDDKIDSSKEIVIEEMASKTGLTIEIMKKEGMLDNLVELIDSIVEKEGMYYHDLRKIGLGRNSLVYSIGSKVIKLGLKKKNYALKSNKRFLNVIYKADFLSGIDGRFLIHIEVTNLVDTESATMEMLYQIYKELRTLGYVWTDCRLDNIGKLLSDNNDTESEGVFLKRGDMVILDGDYIYTLDEFANLGKDRNSELSNIYNYNLLKSLEDRYQLETLSGKRIM